MIKKISFTFLLFILSINIYSLKINFKEEFTKANDFYEKKMYKDALNGYLSLLKNGYDNFNINYNIGCCYYNLDELGKSRFYFEQSLFYKPFDKDLKNNLNIVYNKLQILSSGEQIIMSKRIIYFIPTAVLILLLIIFILAAIILGFFTFFSKNNKKIFFIIFIITEFFSLIINILFFSQYIDFNNKTFVSTSKLSNVFATPNDYETILLTIQEGTSGNIIEEIDYYVKINLSNGSSGWIKKEDLIFKGSYKN